MRDVNTDTTGKIKWWNNLFLKTYINYALLVLVFAFLFGVIFLQLYRKSNTENYRIELEDKAQKIATRLGEGIKNDDVTGSLEYLEILWDLQDDEVWTISNKNAAYPMSEEMVSIDLADATLQKDYQHVITAAFSGEKEYRTFYSATHESTVIIVGVPIYGVNREVCGALLLIAPMTSMDLLISNSLYLIFISAVIALFIAFILSLVFARKISGPIQKMRLTALELADGRYESKTGIDRKDEIGDLARTIDFLTDKLQENEEIRKNMEQMRLDFFANVSHELRTPIAVVRAYAETLVDGVVTDKEKVNQYYDRMLSECKSMERLVGDLLTLSKMQNPDFVVDKEPVNLVHIFEDLRRSVRAISEERNINVELSKNSDVYMMMGDYDRLRQMFLVILDNAVKFSQDNSTVYITLEQDDKIRVSIRDTGVGISKEELPSIFEKFYKSKLRQNAKGSGLGLAIAKQIALKHNGMIEVESEPGVGTEFRFIFDYITENECLSI